MTRRRAIVLLLSASSAIAACGADGTGPVRWVTAPGIIDTSALSSVPVLDGPDTLQAGVPAEFVVNTFGSTTCTHPERVDRLQRGLAVELRPFDQVPERPIICTADVSPRPHPVELTFPRAGEATILVIGEAYDPEAEAFRPDTLRFGRVVRP
jgi:hypothetical protein